MHTTSQASRKSVRLSDIAENAILALFERGLLPRGAVLLEGPIADRLGMSRAPVRLALQNLSEAGRVHRFSGRGYVIGEPSDVASPHRIDLRQINWPKEAAMPADRRDKLASEQIHDALHDAIISVIPFGRYRISESDIAAHFGVGRAVARETLFHLLKSGLIDKDARSHWIAGPLTAEMTRDLLAIRSALEPTALELAAPHLCFDSLERTRSLLQPETLDAKAVSASDLIALETRFRKACFDPCPNKRLLSALDQAILPSIVTVSLARAKGSVDVTQRVHGQIAVLDALLANEQAEACRFLQTLVSTSAERTVMRLKLLSILPSPQTPGFMTSYGQT